MRILFVVESLIRGGAEGQIALFANHLSEQGHAVALLLLTDLPIDYEIRREVGIERTGLQRTDPRAVLRIQQTARRFHPDVLVAFLPVPIGWARFWKRCFGPMTALVTSIASTRYRPYPLWILFEMLTWRLDDRVHSNSENTRSFLTDMVRGRGDRIDLIYNGVDTLRFRPPEDCRQALRQRLGIPADAFLLISLASLQYVKGHDLMLDALALLKRAGCLPPRLHLALVGGVRENGYRERITRRIRQEALEEVVSLAGETNQPELWLQAADVLILASRWEGFPNVILEAMACGTPWMATPVSDLPSLSLKTNSGIIFADTSSKSIADGIFYIAGLPPETLNTMGNNGREWILRCCTKDIIGLQFEHLLSDALKSREARPAL